jgi:hypothetical protein
MHVLLVSRTHGAGSGTRLCQQLLHRDPRTSEYGGGHQQDYEPVKGTV